MKRLAGAALFVTGAMLMVVSAIPCLGPCVPTLSPEGKDAVSATWLYTLLAVGVAMLVVGRVLTILGSRLWKRADRSEEVSSSDEVPSA